MSKKAAQAVGYAMFIVTNAVILHNIFSGGNENESKNKNFAQPKSRERYCSAGTVTVPVGISCSADCCRYHCRREG